ncbi:MAG: hypothetical protein HFH14_10700 [Lachnospiraceae bacterium]|nr:hypothetical protein [Lachnospiraceae bacterium]
MYYNVSANHIANNIITSGNSYTYTRKVTKTVADEKETAISSLAYKLMKTGSRLFSADYSSGASANVKLKLKDFVKSYNELSKKINDSGSKKSKEDFKQLSKLISENESSLKKIGISLDKGELKVDEEKLSKITSKYKITSAFKGETNMLSNIIKYATRISNDLKNKTALQEYPNYKTVELDSNSAASAISSAGIFNSLDALSRYGYSENNRQSITDMIKSYVTNYNKLISGDSNALIDELKDITTSYRDRLADSGIHITGDNLSVDENELSNSPIDNLRELFSGEEGYVKETGRIARQLFDNYVQASSNDINLTY